MSQGNGSEDRFEQSAVVPFRRNGAGTELCLITSLRRRRWIVPKGIVEPGLTPEASAAKEALEEAGLAGRVWPVSIGEYEVKKWGGVCRVRVYLMRVEQIHDTWLEDEWRDRRWLSVSDAAGRAHPKGLARLLGEVPTWIDALDLGRPTGRTRPSGR